MRRYRWTSKTMEVTDLGGAYVTYADHLRAMAELEERLKSAVAEKPLVDVKGAVVGVYSVPKPQCPVCHGRGVSSHCGPCVKCGARRVAHSQGSHCDCQVCSGKPKPFVKLYTCNMCKDTGCPDCY